MALIAPLVNLLGLEAQEMLQRTRESAVIYAAIALFAVVCFIFLLVALNAALLPWVGPIWAPLIIAGGALVIAAILYIVLKVQMATRRRQQLQRRREAETNSLLTGAAIAAVPELLRSPLVRNIGLPLAIYAGVLLLSPRKTGRRS
jgi:hypothetical protein